MGYGRASLSNTFEANTELVIECCANGAFGPVNDRVKHPLRQANYMYGCYDSVEK